MTIRTFGLGSLRQLYCRADLRSSSEECHVAGFTDAYTAYLQGPGGDAADQGWLALFVGWIAVAVAGATYIFGPDEILYYAHAGMTFLQHIQANPGPIMSFGLLCLAVGKRLRTKGGMSRESYLQAHYQFISDDGRDVSNEVHIRDLGNDNFYVLIGQ